MTSAEPNFRVRAIEHVALAKLLLNAGDPPADVHACLRLRLAIEALTYERVAYYRNDLSVGVLKAWRPSKLLAALQRLDPGSDADVSLEIGYDEDRPIRFDEVRLKADWAKQTHVNLSAYLHDGPLAVVQSSQTLNQEFRCFLLSVLDELERVTASSGFGLMFLQEFDGTCECGTELELKIPLTQARKSGSCLACGRDWKIERLDEQSVRVLVSKKPPAARAAGGPVIPT